ncbi:MAG: pantetheine-phosphate adenylyltransferase [Planctomycetes bacterium]|nr:pantetheine-phosphate adenylyltransferase [Planctomycetota bacterium]
MTSGHIDIIRRGAAIFERLTVGVARNPGKRKPLFSLDERLEMIRELVQDLDNVDVKSFEGMTVDFVRSMGAKVILRGIRTFGDFEYEFQLALANRSFKGIETVFVMANEENSFISSTLIKEAASLGADISRFVPESVSQRLHEKLANKSNRDTAGLQGEEPNP